MYIKKEIVTTADDYKQLVYFTQFRRRKFPLIFTIICEALAFAAVVTGVIGVIRLPVAIAAAVVFAAATFFFPIKTAKIARSGIKHGKVAINAKRTLEIDTGDIKIYGGRTGTDIKAAWPTVFAAYELKGCFFVYITHDKAFCITKAGMLPTDIYNLRNAFTKRLGRRFYIKCRR